jgi:hypothetical protein
MLGVVAHDGSPLPQWADATCVVCPAQRLGPGCFDVVDQPDRRYRFDPRVGHRVDAETGVAVCVHPFRVGLAPGAYASAGVAVRSVAEGAMFTPSADQLALPHDADDLEAWLIAMLRTAEPDQMASALDHAETLASERFSPDKIVNALRRVLAHELPR